MRIRDCGGRKILFFQDVFRGRSIVVITCASQAWNEGSIPSARTSFQSGFEQFRSGAQPNAYKPRRRISGLSVRM